MKSVGILANPLKEGIGGAIELVADWCESQALELIVDDRNRDAAPSSVRCVPSSEVVARADLIFAFGGDGALLFAAREVAAGGRETPIFGVNMGSLGFLTQIAGDELGTVLAALDPAELPVSDRMMLSVGLSGRDGTDVALNDVVITKAAESRMLSFEARVDGELVTRYAADGLILATPTGSTAHALSAGGPVVAPNVEAIILAPICPHTLSLRPLVVPPTVEIEIQMLSSDDATIVTADGHKVFGIGQEDVVVVRTADTRARLVEIAEHSYYEILRRKMRWAGRVRER
jgi:NAD+ kinase